MQSEYPTGFWWRLFLTGNIRCENRSISICKSSKYFGGLPQSVYTMIDNFYYTIIITAQNAHHWEPPKCAYYACFVSQINVSKLQVLCACITHNIQDLNLSKLMNKFSKLLNQEKFFLVSQNFVKYFKAVIFHLSQAQRHLCQNEALLSKYIYLWLSFSQI